MTSAEELGRIWADSRWSQADLERRKLPFVLPAGCLGWAESSLEALQEAILWALEEGLLASEVSDMQRAAKVRWEELQATGGPEAGGGGGPGAPAGRVHRYLGEVK